MEAGSGLELSDFTVGDTAELRHGQAFTGSLCLFPSVPPPTHFFLRQGFFPAFLASFWGIGQAPAYWLEMNELQGANELRR